MSDGSVTIKTKLDDSGAKKGLGTLSSTLGKVGSGITSAFKVGATAIAGVTTAFAGLVAASVNARGELEQQIGGIETLFTNELGSASETVIKNANNAYKTAGMSAIEYMSTATSFSASLLQSLGQDTQKAAEITDMAITDMADNANKMGTSMESIQWAYQGFAKQNYTMLDNLKLGYGGTKTEMERLLKDAQKLTGVKYDISNLSDVYTAIHVIQEELGITGTTAAEAADTLQGSFSSMKAAWNNFLSGSGDLSQVVDTANDVVKNVIRIANEAIPSIMENIVESLPGLLDLGAQIINQLITGIVTYLPTLAESAGQILTSLIQGILTTLPQIIPVAIQVIQQFLMGLLSYLPQIILVGVQIITQLIVGIAQMMPQLIPQAVNAIITLVNGLIDNLPALIDAGIQLLLGVVTGIVQALPQLIDAIPQIITKLVETLTRPDMLGRIIEGAIRLMVALAAGLIQAIPQILGAIPQIISSIGEAFKDYDWGALGQSLLQGLLNGFSNAGNIIWSAIKKVGSSMIDGIKSFFGIHSPSRVFANLGEYLPQGFAVGIDRDATVAVKSVNKMNKSILKGFNFDGLYSKMQNAVNLETGKIATTLSTTATTNKILTANITVNPSDIYMDSTKVGRAVTPAVTKTLRGVGVC